MNANRMILADRILMNRHFLGEIIQGMKVCHLVI